MTKKNNKEIRTPYDAVRLFSALTHGIGFWLASGGVAVLVVLSAMVGSAWEIVSYSIYGAALIGAYATSTLYHSLKVRPEKRFTLRKLDHIMIYFLIAGTYTPICLIALRDFGAWGWALFGIIWGMAVTGTIVKLFWLTAPRWASAAAYVGMGWLVAVAMVPIVRDQALSPLALTFLLSGGFFYTAGGVLYALRWPGRERKWFGFHEVFHVFILLGSICHFIMMFWL